MENIVKSEKETRTPIEVMLGMTEDNMVSAKALYDFLELTPLFVMKRRPQVEK